MVHLVAAVKSAELSSDVLRVANVPEERWIAEALV
jgi:hypothetical protein